MEKVAMLLFLVALGLGSCMATNTCIADGKFIADYQCTSYVVCIRNDTDFLSYTIPCPTGFNVRYLDMVCSRDNECDPNFSCTSLGNFPNPTRTSGYISCVQGLGNIIIALSRECIAPLEFNAASGICDEMKIVTTTHSEITAMSSTETPTNVRTEVIPPTFTTTTQKITPRMPNSSASNFASYPTVLAIVLYNIFGHRLNVDV